MSTTPNDPIVATVTETKVRDQKTKTDRFHQVAINLKEKFSLEHDSGVKSGKEDDQESFTLVNAVPLNDSGKTSQMTLTVLPECGCLSVAMNGLVVRGANSQNVASEFKNLVMTGIFDNKLLTKNEVEGLKDLQLGMAAAMDNFNIDPFEESLLITAMKQLSDSTKGR